VSSAVRMTAIAVGVAIAIGAGYGIAHLQNTGNAAPMISESQAQSVSAVPADGERKILYYRNPMGLPDTSPVPKKDSMGMDYIPVYRRRQAGRQWRGGGEPGAHPDPGGEDRRGRTARRGCGGARERPESSSTSAGRWWWHRASRAGSSACM